MVIFTSQSDMNASHDFIVTDKPLLHDFSIIQSHDLAVLQETVSHEFCDHSLSFDDNASHTSTFNGFKSGGIGFFYLQYGSTATIRPKDISEFYMIQIPLYGQAHISIDSNRIISNPQQGSLLQPHNKISMTWENGMGQMIIYIPVAKINDYLLSHDIDCSYQSVIFSHTVLTDQPLMQHWLQLIKHYTELAVGASQLKPFISTDLQQMIIGHLLASQPNNFQQSLFRPKMQAPKILDSVIEYIQTYYYEPLTVEAMAIKCGYSIRNLQKLFHNHMGCSPLQYLSDYRLKCAQEMLITALPSETTVSDIAYAAGFTHLGRFSTLYKQTFGESPRETLYYKS